MSKKPTIPKPRKTHVIGVRVDDDLKAAIEADAEKETRSLSQWFVMAAKAMLKGRKP